MATSRYCRACRNFHDLSEPWPEACYGHFASAKAGSSPQIIKDIEPYQAVATDIATGTAPVIRSRREHQEFLRRNRYVEVGNEYNKGPLAKPIENDSPREAIRSAVREVLGRR